jgi:hypothetical protein
VSDRPTIFIPDLCEQHQSLLVHQAGYSPTDPWRALIVVANVALFQGASADSKVQAECQGDITKISQLGCMACRKPDLFGEIVEAAKTRDLGAIKTMGERWVTDAAKP